MDYNVWLGSAAIALSIVIMWWSFQGGERVDAGAVRRNLQSGTSSSYRGAVLDRPATERLLDPILSRLARIVVRILPTTWFDRLDQRLAKAGLLGRVQAEQVIGAKALLAILVAVAMSRRALAEPSVTTIGYLTLGVVLAWFLPDLYLASRGDRRIETIERELPDVLDQLTVSVEAGLGFEAAMARIGERNRSMLASEFARALQDIQLGVSRIEALEGISERTQSADVKQLILALRQAERMGVPLAETLRIQASESRSKRKLRAQEAAYKLPVKMIFPLGLCILPALFIVILGPAVIQISELFG